MTLYDAAVLALGHASALPWAWIAYSRGYLAGHTSGLKWAKVRLERLTDDVRQEWLR